MSEVKEKAVLMTIDNVRIKEYDSMNVEVERLETYYKPPKEKGGEREKVEGWKFKGYSDTVSGALKAIQRKELLIDKKAVSDLSGYLNEVEKSNARLIKAIEEAGQ